MFEFLSILFKDLIDCLPAARSRARSHTSPRFRSILAILVALRIPSIVLIKLEAMPEATVPKVNTPQRWVHQNFPARFLWYASSLSCPSAPRTHVCSQPSFMAGFSIALATQVVSVNVPRIPVAVTVAHCFVHASIVVNVIAFVLTELCKAPGQHEFAQVVQNAFVSAGALLPAAAAIALFAGTQPLEAILAAVATLLLGFAGCVAVWWFRQSVRQSPLPPGNPFENTIATPISPLPSACRMLCKLSRTFALSCTICDNSTISRYLVSISDDPGDATRA